MLSTDARDRIEAIEWVFGALNSVEMASVPWSIFVFYGFARATARPSFIKAHADQLAHFAAGDAALRTAP